MTAILNKDSCFVLFFVLSGLALVGQSTSYVEISNIEASNRQLIIDDTLYVIGSESFLPFHTSGTHNVFIKGTLQGNVTLRKEYEKYDIYSNLYYDQDRNAIFCVQAKFNDLNEEEFYLAYYDRQGNRSLQYLNETVEKALIDFEVYRVLNVHVLDGELYLTGALLNNEVSRLGIGFILKLNENLEVEEKFIYREYYSFRGIFKDSVGEIFAIGQRYDSPVEEQGPILSFDVAFTALSGYPESNSTVLGSGSASNKILAEPNRTVFNYFASETPNGLLLYGLREGNAGMFFYSFDGSRKWEIDLLEDTHIWALRNSDLGRSVANVIQRSNGNIVLYLNLVLYPDAGTHIARQFVPFLIEVDPNGSVVGEKVLYKYLPEGYASTLNGGYPGNYNVAMIGKLLTAKEDRLILIGNAHKYRNDAYILEKGSVFIIDTDMNYCFEPDCAMEEIIGYKPKPTYYTSGRNKWLIHNRAEGNFFWHTFNSNFSGKMYKSAYEESSWIYTDESWSYIPFPSIVQRHVHSDDGVSKSYDIINEYASVGDRMNTGYFNSDTTDYVYQFLESVDTIFFADGRKKRRLRMRCEETLNGEESAYTWIESMGCVEYFRTSHDLCIGNAVNEVIVCFYQDGELMWSNPDYEYCAPSAVEEVEETSFSIHPNPASNSIHLSVPVSSYQLYDLSGTWIKGDNGNLIREIDISDLHSGLYILQVQEMNGRSRHIKVFKG